MSKISKEEVFKLAKLAHLDVTDEEVATYQKEFSAMINYFDQLSSVDLSGYKPTNQVTGKVNATRLDVVAHQVEPKELLKNAPALKNGQFKVRRMIG